MSPAFSTHAMTKTFFDSNNLHKSNKPSSPLPAPLTVFFNRQKADVPAPRDRNARQTKNLDGFAPRNKEKKNGGVCWDGVFLYGVWRQKRMREERKKPSWVFHGILFSPTSRVLYSHNNHVWKKNSALSIEPSNYFF